MRRFYLLLLLFFSFISAASAQVVGIDTSTLVKVRIVPEKGRIEPGETIWLAVEQVIKPEWHTYWKNPGDSGAEPRIKWELPEGFSAGAIVWPTPDKIPYGPLLNYGYSNRVILLQELTAPDTLPAGQIDLKAAFEVLVCKDECIPAFSDHVMSLNGEGAEAEDNSGFITLAKNKLPKSLDGDVYLSEDNGNLVVTAPIAVAENSLGSVDYFPEDWGLVENPAPVAATVEDGKLVIRQKRGTRPLNEVQNTNGIIAYVSPDGVRESFAFEAHKPGMLAAIGSILPAKAPETTQDAPATVQSGDLNFLQAFLFALLGGLILNLMPCVFPVLSMKAVSLVKISEKHPEVARLHGISYTAGVMLSFLAVAGALLAVKAAGHSVGWGFQLQNPVVVSLLAYMLFILGLNLSGYFEFGNTFGNAGQKLTQGSHYSHSFFTGVLATLVATPCTAPFMAGAIGFALVQNTFVSLSVFAALGFGLALPYLALSFIPALQSRLPKPGAWMEHFKHFLAFPMFGSVVWLVWVLSQQAGSAGVLSVLLGMLGITFGLWLAKHTPAQGAGRFVMKALTLAALVVPVATLPSSNAQNPAPAMKIEMGKAFSPEALETALAGDVPVFVEMTAAWCITCKVNHAVAINIPSTRRVFEERNVEYLVGDWTNYDPQITEFLNAYGRNGVPVYVYYGPRDAATAKRPEPKVLPQILVPGTVGDIVEDSFKPKGE